MMHALPWWVSLAVMAAWAFVAAVAIEYMMRHR